MKAAFLHGAAIAVALIVGVHLAAKASPSSSSETRCPWIAEQVAASNWEPAEQPDAQPQAGDDSAGAELAVPHPMTTVDCARDGWRRFTAPGFDSQEACVGWVLEYLRPRMIETLPPGDAREFDFPQSGTGTGAILRTGAPLLI